MGWAAGVYTRLFGSTGWADDKNASTKILASRHDSHDQDVATALNNCILRDGTGVPTANTPWNSKKITGLLDPTSAQDAASKNYVDTTAIKRDGTAAPTANVGWGTFKITGLGDPTSAQDAATKAYVDTSGSFTATLVGCTTSPTATCYYAKSGNIATVYIASVTGTSNSTSLSMTGVPVAIRPTREQKVMVPDSHLTDNGTAVGVAYAGAHAAVANFQTDGSIIFNRDNTPANWTASGTKGVGNPITLTYLLN
jgi:hypothetical protein